MTGTMSLRNTTSPTGTMSQRLNHLHNNGTMSRRSRPKATVRQFSTHWLPKP